MATDAFHQKIAEQVFVKMTSANMTSFNENAFFKDLYRILRRHNAMDGKSYHGRVVKPLVEKMFKKLQEERLKELKNFVLT